MLAAMFLKAGGFAVAMLGMVCWFRALAHVAPRHSVWTTVWLGNLQRREAFTETGWRLRQRGVLLGVIGSILAGLGILLS